MLFVELGINARGITTIYRRRRCFRYLHRSCRVSLVPLQRGLGIEWRPGVMDKKQVFSVFTSQSRIEPGLRPNVVFFDIGEPTALFMQQVEYPGQVPRQLLSIFCQARDQNPVANAYSGLAMGVGGVYDMRDIQLDQHLVDDFGGRGALDDPSSPAGDGAT